LEEELDALRVQSAMDRATIQDLNICLKQERDELTARVRSARREEGRVFCFFASPVSFVDFFTCAVDMLIL